MLNLKLKNLKIIQNKTLTYKVQTKLELVQKQIYYNNNDQIEFIIHF